MEVEEPNSTSWHQSCSNSRSSPSASLLLTVTAAFLAISLLIIGFVVFFFLNNANIHGFPSSSSTSLRRSNPAAAHLPNVSRHHGSSSVLEKASVLRNNGNGHEQEIRRDRKLEKVEESLAMARALIKEAAMTLNHSCCCSSSISSTSSSALHQDLDYVPYGHLYRNPCAFHRSYLLMEKMFKIFVYQEGDPPLFHDGPCKSIYSMEGLFISFMETDHANFKTNNPDDAHVYFLPFSVVKIIEHLFHPIFRDKAVLERTVVDYVRIISDKYPFWNRSHGADHFMLSCHDWGPRATWYERKLYYNSIRVLCNANTSEHFNPKKDASFPEINLVTGEIPNNVNDDSLASGSNTRETLAFFAGRMHGKIRPLLFKNWRNKDLDIQVHETLPEGISYQEMMRKSKFCLCPSGHEVASPRIPEAIYAGCVPVLISKNYVLPFSDVLNWEAFSVQVSIEEIEDLKKILMGIPEERYLELVRNVEQVRRHFEVNDPPRRFDVFHMILHSVWLRRLNFRILS